MVFTLGPSVHLPRLATLAGLGTISHSSDIVRFVQGGVVKTFRLSQPPSKAPYFAMFFDFVSAEICNCVKTVPELIS